MKRGAFILAVATQAPIVPVVIKGAFEALQRGSWVVRPARIEVEFAEPIATRGFTEATRSELMQRTARVMEEALTRRVGGEGER